MIQPVEWFEEHFGDFQAMFWPPTSSDIDPIEQLWEGIFIATLPPRNVWELQDQLVSAWYHISLSTPCEVNATLGAGSFEG